MAITFSCLHSFSIVIVHLLIYNLDYLHGSQTIWDKHFSCHLGKTSFKTHICLQLNISRFLSFLVQFEWCKKQHKPKCKLSIIFSSSRSKGATQKKRKTCLNQLMCFFKKWPIILECYVFFISYSFGVI
jgi:hypothetical protein